MAFKAIVTGPNGEKAILTQDQLDLLPGLILRVPAKRLDAALIEQCKKFNCPIDFAAQADDGN